MSWRKVSTLSGFLGLLLVVGAILPVAQPIFQAPSGCKEGAIITTEQALNPGTGGFTQDRTIIPGEDTTVVLGAWLIIDAYVADPTANPANPNCAFSPGDGNPLYVVELKLRPVSGDPVAVGVKSVTFWLDNDFDAQFTPGRDTQFGMPLPGSCLSSSEGCVLTFGNSPIFGGPAGLADPMFGGFCPPLATAGGCAAIFAVADIENPQAGATLQVRMEGKAANLVNNPFPIGSDFSPQFAKTASSIRVRVEGVPGSGGGGGTPPPGGGRGGGGVLSPSVNNGNGNSETGVAGISITGIRTRDDRGGLSGTGARDARPGDREYFVGMVAICEGGQPATREVSILPAAAGAAPTIAGGLAAIPCIPSPLTDGFPTNIVRVRVGVSGPGAQYVQSVHLYGDLDLDGVLFEASELMLSGIPVGGIAALGSLEQVLVFPNGTMAIIPDGTPLPVLLYVTVDIDDRAQASSVRLQVAVDVAALTGFPSSRLMNTTPAEFNFQITGGTTAPPPGPGPGPSPGGLQQFDTNGNCVIDDPEFFNAVNTWVMGQLDNATFFDLIDAWIQRTNVCVSGSGTEIGDGEDSAVTLRVSPGRATFAMFRPRPVSLNVRVFDPSGREVFSQSVGGRSLVWRYRDGQGRPLANGVYLAVVRAVRADGRISQEIFKIPVLR